jgi:hypothetical protein
MSALRRKIDALTATLASDFVRAVREEAKRELAKATPKKSVAKKKEPTAPVAKKVDDDLMRVALAFFAERGAKGATVAQLEEHAGSAGGSEVVAALTQRGALRDTGMRRATGKGTAAVFVAKG